MATDLNKLIIEDLVKERNRIAHEIQDLQTELKVVQKMIDKRTKSVLSNTPLGVRIVGKPKKPIQAIHELLKNNAGKDFTPTEIREEMEYLRKQGLLLSDAKNLLWVVHSALRTLFMKGLVTRTDENNNVYYSVEKNEY